MTVSLSLAFSYHVVLIISRLFTTSRGADILKYPGKESLSVLLLTSSDPGYFSEPLIRSEWVSDLLRKASENGSYELELLFLDTEVYKRHYHLISAKGYPCTSCIYIPTYYMQMYS